MEAASPCFNRSGGPPSVRSTSNHRQLAFFCAAVVHPLLPNPGAAPNPFYHMIPASPVGDGAVHRSWLIPPAPLRLSWTCSSIDVRAVIRCTANILSPANLQLGEVSNCSWRRSRPAVICTNTSPGGIDCSLSRLSLPPRSTTYGRRCSNHPPPLSVADACNHVQPPTGCGHRGRAMPRELELHHPQPVPLQVVHPTNHTIFFSLSILLPLCFCSSRCFKRLVFLLSVMFKSLVL
ncbi:uncharacterized protein [Triticum aestivum]|uniref:uncharacterized protein isoform X1 n=1 Tax=Triticum aestivum TaxID=4565 RepID=UPI001D01616D|nr:uncharacterized protein LOC123159937 isoform X1 [Triticum aestivum]